MPKSRAPRVLFAPQADSYRDIDFGVEHVFLFQPLHQAVRDEFVVFRGAQVLGDVLEGEQKPLKIFIAVKCIDFGLGDVFAVALAKFEERGRLDCAFQVKV